MTKLIWSFWDGIGRENIRGRKEWRVQSSIFWHDWVCHKSVKTERIWCYLQRGRCTHGMSRFCLIFSWKLAENTPSECRSVFPSIRKWSWTTMHGHGVYVRWKFVDFSEKVRSHPWTEISHVRNASFLTGVKLTFLIVYVRSRKLSVIWDQSIQFMETYARKMWAGIMQEWRKMTSPQILLHKQVAKLIDFSKSKTSSRDSPAFQISPYSVCRFVQCTHWNFVENYRRRKWGEVKASVFTLIYFHWALLSSE